MVEYILEITLQSSLTSAAGEGRVGIADRDIAFDDLGLPILPGKRLKGLWRDAYRDVFDAWTLCGQSPIPVEDIFGKAGQTPDSTKVRLHVESAVLEEASSLRPWLYYLQDPKDQKMFPEDVVQHYANVRTQTAIDRHTGAAKENTLRSIRTLQADLVFQARVRFATTPEDAVIAALESGAAALQYMGTARTRGFGKVCCRFFKADSTQTVPNTTIGRGRVTPVSSLGVPTHLLKYRLILRQSVVIPVTDGDPNTVATRQDIPGSHLWGVAAWHYLNQTGNTPAADAAFRRVFLDEGLRFLTAYPETSNSEKQRLIPIPHSIRKLKKDESLKDFVDEPPNILNENQTKRHDRHYCRINSEYLETQVVRTERNYHHARAKDRRKGRALGAEVPDGGAFFTYEAIKAGQSFQGAVLGSESDLKSLQEWLKEVDSIRLGRSRSAQYGEAEFEWVGEVQPLNGLSEWNGFNLRQADSEEDCHTEDNWEEDDRWNEDEILDEEENEEWDEDEKWDEERTNGIIRQKNADDFNLGDQLVITTLSPLLTVNAQGHPDTRFPERELVRVLGLDTSETNLTLSRSYTRTEMIGGYHTHLRLPRQQLPAIAAGSVFVFDIKDFQDDITEDKFLKLEHNGLGLRKGEGYGRVAVDHLKIDIRESETLLDDPENQNYRTQPSEGMPEKVQKLLWGITRTRCLAEVQQRAIAAAAEKKVRNVPRNSLLGRLRLFLQLDPSGARENLINLPEPTKKKLKGCQIDTSVGDTSWLSEDASLTLYDLFETAWTKPESLLDNRDEHEKGFWYGLLKIETDHRYADMDKTEIEALVDEMCKLFLNQLLTALHRRARK